MAKEYTARKNNEGTFIARDEQMDEFLQKGYQIVEIEGDKERVIATPEEGFLEPRPTIVKSGRSVSV